MSLTISTDRAYYIFFFDAAYCKIVDLDEYVGSHIQDGSILAFQVATSRDQRQGVYEVLARVGKRGVCGELGYLDFGARPFGYPGIAFDFFTHGRHTSRAAHPHGRAHI